MEKLKTARHHISWRKCSLVSAVEELSLKDIVDDLMHGINIPVLSDLPHGHFASRVVLPIGVNASIDGNRGKLAMTEKAVD